MMSGSTVALTGLAQACNVFWQVTSSATIGTNAAFVGTVLALSDIQAQTGATIQGRLLARNGQVTLDDNRITKPTCAAVVPPVVVPVFVPPAVTTTTTSTTVAPTTTTTSTTSTTIKKVTTPTTAKGTTTPTPVAPGTSDASVGSDVVTPVAAGGRSGSGSGSGAGGSTSEGTRRVGSSSTAIGGGLPRTGSSLAPWAVTGLIAVLLGGSITVLAAGGARRRS
jgi:type VI secretion system secreted protein VgrG